MNTTPKTVNITVSGGTGNATIGGVNAVSSGFSVIPPSAQAGYDLDITDASGFGVAGRASLIGNTTVRDRFQVWGTITITISSATQDGTYKFQLWFAE